MANHQGILYPYKPATPRSKGGGDRGDERRCHGRAQWLERLGEAGPPPPSRPCTASPAAVPGTTLPAAPAVPVTRSRGPQHSGCLLSRNSTHDSLLRWGTAPSSRGRPFVNFELEEKQLWP